MPELDLIILGGGPAGMSALLWSHSLNLRGALIEQAPELGGQMLQMFHRIFDYPGLAGLTGIEMRDRFLAHLNQLNLDYRSDCKIDSVDLSAKTIVCNGENLSARAIIIATGARKRRLHISGEDKFETSGVSFSATRDHSLYAGKKVCVIGGGDSAVENALILSRVSPQVTLLHRSDKFRARQSWMEQAKAASNISIVEFAEPQSIEGSDHVERLIIRDLRTGERRTIETEGVFIKVGIAPNTELFRGQIELDDAGYIKADSRQRTSVENVYAIGDVCRPVCLSVATAVGQGAIAAKDVANHAVGLSGNGMEA